MGLFSRSGGGTSVALIEINSSSVAGGLVHIEGGKQPVMCYTTREPFEAGEYTSVLTTSMLRALTVVGDRLVREGAPALRTGVGDGSVDRILVSIGTPWQDTKVETKVIQKPEPFTFSKSLVEEVLQDDEEAEDRLRTRSVIATLLNGYLVANPYGKSAKRADCVVLTANLEKRVMESVEEMLRRAFHTRDVTYTSFVEPTYHVLRDLYPRENDFLFLSVTGETTVIASIKRMHLLDVGSIDCGARSFKREDTCVETLATALKEFATRHALPRTVFIFTSDGVEDILKAALNAPALRELWLSDEPVTVVPFQPSHLTGRLKIHGLAHGDARLGILALYAALQEAG